MENKIIISKVIKIFCIFVFVANISLAANITGGLLIVPPAINNIKTIIKLKTITMKKEIWKSVKCYEGIYEVSNLGRVKSILHYVNTRYNKRKVNEKILKLTKSKNGYIRIGLSKNGKQIIYSVHRLVAISFIQNINNLRCVHHKDSNKHNNNLENLEWISIKDNTKRAYLDGLFKPVSPTKGKFGKDNHRSKPIAQFTKDNVLIDEFESSRDAMNKTGIDYRLISKVITGKNKTAKGYIWKLIMQK